MIFVVLNLLSYSLIQPIQLEKFTVEQRFLETYVLHFAKLMDNS